MTRPRIDLDELEKLATAATPGRWVAGWENDWKGTAAVVACLDGEEVDTAVTGDIDHRDAKFMAAVQPAPVLALVAQLREARA